MVEAARTPRSGNGRRKPAGERTALANHLASVGDAVIATDARGNIDFMNGIAEYLTGWGLKTAKGRSIIEVFNIINETTGETVESPVEHVLREGAIVGLANHTVLVRRDGTQIPIDDSGAPIRNEDGIINGVVLVFRDVPKRKEQEQALRKSEKPSARLFEHSSVGKILTNYDGKILRLNQAMADMLVIPSKN
jgi:PAS domain S-box-containing protein